MKFIRNGWALLLLGLVSLIGLMTLRLLTAPDQAIPMGHEQVNDDFALTILGARRIGERLAVRIRYDNHAKAVSSTFTPNMVKIFSGSGDQLAMVDGGGGPKTLSAGESYDCELVYDAKMSDGPYTARFSLSGSAGDFLDTLFSGRQHTVLPEE